MKKIGKTIIPLFLAIAMLTSCNSLSSTPTTSQTDARETDISIVETKIVMTQVVIPIATFPSPTEIPPGDYSNNYAPPPGKLDYAKTIFRKHYALFPYIDKEKGSYGLEYYGCVETSDFGGSITYNAASPIETVDNTFSKYFKKDNWEFLEAVHGIESGLPTITYEVYRIKTGDTPAFEQLQVVLYDFTQALGNGQSETRIRSNLVHVENRKYFSYVFDFVNYPCKKWYAFNTGW